MATNNVIAGDLSGFIRMKNVFNPVLYIEENKLFRPKQTLITKDTVESIEIVQEDAHISMGSSIIRSVAGAALLGGFGAIAGAVSAKKKGEHIVSIIFKDGQKALCKLDDAMYKWLITTLY